MLATETDPAWLVHQRNTEVEIIQSWIIQYYDIYNMGDMFVNFYKDGYHCQDLVPATESDPAWLVHQRNTEVQIIQSWIKEYYDEVNI
ncbi:hypothetical protein MTR_2g075270 [Medicago truncatula]|uniref:Uncharacterized protein n=1 Tax=Medicago truncatula TaxID=3880 RepID=G7IQZ4_MEDTR|nr:hypothetical protein MTR_2g075270 [Medicago truncatula]